MSTVFARFQVFDKQVSTAIFSTEEEMNRDYQLSINSSARTNYREFHSIESAKEWLDQMEFEELGEEHAMGGTMV